MRTKKVGKKIVGKKCEKRFFYIHTNIVTKKWGEQNARNSFSRNTLIVGAKNVGEKIGGKKCEKRFLYSHEYHDQKIEGTKRAKLFLQKHTISASKKCLEKNRRKKVRNRFFIFTRIS